MSWVWSSWKLGLMAVQVIPRVLQVSVCEYLLLYAFTYLLNAVKSLHDAVCR